MAKSSPSRAATSGRTTRPPARPGASKAALARHKRRRAQWLAMVAGLSIVTIVVVIATVGGRSSGPPSNTTAAAFDLPRFGAEGRVTLAAHRGRPTVVNMFASWCDQCEAELPGFQAAASKLTGQVDFVFVNSNETGSGKAMAERHGLFAFDVARDTGGTQGNGLYRSYGGTGGMPMTAFYDADGTLLQAFPGALVGNNLPAALKQLYGVTV